MAPLLCVGCVLIVFISALLFLHQVKFYTKVAIYLVGFTVFSNLAIFPALYHRTRTSRHAMFTIWAMRMLNRLCLGFRCEVRNRRYLEAEDRAGIVLLNHQSAMDAQALMEIGHFPGLVPMVKNSLFYTGPFGIFLYIIDSIFLKRGTAQARKEVEKVVARIQREKLKPVIFPEGTRNNSGVMLPFKKGAFHLAVRAQVPIIPVVLSSYSYFFDGRKKVFNTGKVLINVLEPISTEGLTEDDVPTLTEEVRETMMKEFRTLNKEIEEINVVHEESKKYK